MLEDASKLVAALRPGMARAALPVALREARNRFWLGDLRWYIEFDQADRIQSINYSAGFPNDQPIDDLTIGVSRDELISLVPDAQMLAAYPDVKLEFLLLPGEGSAVRRAQLNGGRLMSLEKAMESARETRLLRSMDELAARKRVLARPPSDDPDVLLGYWVEDARNLTFDRSVLPRFADWLRSASVDEWHQLASQWHWDNGTVPLGWIIRQPSCDLATAVLVHQAAEPSYFREFAGDRSRIPEWSRDGFDLIVVIRRRISQGRYRPSDLAITKSLEDVGLGDGLVVPARAGRELPAGEVDEGIPIALFVRQ